uniref:L1 transposable element RRM domain-containing protein n=1 Tax=Monodelphis domestica TaxID=13616 RepID=K7E591_MONDO
MASYSEGNFRKATRPREPGESVAPWSDPSTPVPVRHTQFNPEKPHRTDNLPRTKTSEHQTEIRKANPPHSEMANSTKAQKPQNTKKNKKKGATLDTFYGAKIQNTEEIEYDIQKNAPKSSKGNGNSPQTHEEFESEMTKKMEAFWEEKLEIMQKKFTHLQNRCDETEKENQALKARIRQLEDNDHVKEQELIKQSQNTKKLEENIKYLTDKVIDLENRGRRDNLRIIGLPEKPEINTKLDMVIQDIIKENCPEILEQGGNTATDRAHRTPSTLNTQKTTPRNVIAKFQSYQTKEKILQEARKRQFRYKGMPIRVTQDLASSTMNDRKAWNMIFRKARELGLQPRINYPAKLTIYFQGKVWAFNKIEDFQLFAKKRTELCGKFDTENQRARNT